jgi:low temperature requirement protein LtrA
MMTLVIQYLSSGTIIYDQSIMASYKGGRKLFGEPIVLQDWNEAAEERSAQYWELFLDLLLVAAASCVADQFKESQDFWEFAVFALILVNGWMLYTHHITTRFEDASLSHSFLLFSYFAGFGYSIVNAGFEHATSFAAGALLQRLSVAIMLAYIAISIPRARYSCCLIAILMVIPVVSLTIIVLFSGGERLSFGLLTLTAGAELFGEVCLTFFVNTQASIPINIEHTKDRLGTLQLVMLGETASSVVLTYRELLGQLEDVGKSTEKQYYWILLLSFLLIFMFTLLFYHMLPHQDDHPFRRGKHYYGLGLVLHKSLSLSFLSLGVSIKLVVESALLQEELSLFGYQLMGYGVSVSLLILLFIRLMSHGGKATVQFGPQMVYTKGADPIVDRIASIWWTVFGVAWFPPLVGVVTEWTPRDPLGATALHAFLVLVLCVVESAFTHIIAERLTAAPCPVSTPGERHALITTGV